MEIERKFLVTDLPDLGASDSAEIEQGYLALATDTGGAEVRLRRKGDDHVLTVKGGDGLVRIEEEIEIGTDRFASLWPLTEGRRIFKRRHMLELDGLTAELDLFEGELEGLAMVEVEFASERDAEAFDPPAWFGMEVTGDRKYLNETLATARASDVEELVSRS